MSGLLLIATFATILFSHSADVTRGFPRYVSGGLALLAALAASVLVYMEVR